MGPPSSSADESSRSAREAVIRKKINKISKQHKVSQDIFALEKVANHAVAEYEGQRTKLDERRENRQLLAKYGVTLQKFTYTWSQFMKVYAGINEVAKSIDMAHWVCFSKYTPMILGQSHMAQTVDGLQVGENKEGRERAITSTFQEFTESWIGDAGRLKLYLDAYPDSTRLEGFVADVYLGVAELALESAEYYAARPYARFWQAIRRPPKLGIDIKANDIKRAIHEVDSESIALLIQDYAREKEVRKRERKQERFDKSTHIARLLGSSWELGGASKMIDQCKALHTNAFTEAVRRKGTKKLQQISIGLLKDLHLYENSTKTNESSVLVLSGLNFDSYATGDRLCWLSPVTTEIAEKYQLNQQSEGKRRLLFHSACSDPKSRFREQKEPSDVCLSRLILQLLLSDDDFFSKHRQVVEDNIKDSNRHRSDTLQLLLEGCPRTDEVCIIIDRLDHMAPTSDDDTDSDEDYVSDLLRSILEVVSTASCKIRLVVTIDASNWPRVRKDSDFESKWKIWKRDNNLGKFSALFKIDWQQPELRPW
ncbi:MAG: hypothetical protein Q9207_008157 [Kuettlingeria erythrocarpa]